GKGLVEKQAGDLDGRRRTAALTERGAAFEAAIGERLRNVLSRAYRTGGLDGVAGARAILAAMAGGRTRRPMPGGGRP
ncbi:MAG: MarR family transcriptional regulator, partial [Phenylobacterium sp.]|nr:MarR family transcriptional regulator [Phenylobacterium sp.]